MCVTEEQILFYSDTNCVCALTVCSWDQGTNTAMVASSIPVRLFLTSLKSHIFSIFFRNDECLQLLFISFRGLHLCCLLVEFYLTISDEMHLQLSARGLYLYSILLNSKLLTAFSTACNYFTWAFVPSYCKKKCIFFLNIKWLI